MNNFFTKDQKDVIDILMASNLIINDSAFFQNKLAPELVDNVLWQFHDYVVKRKKLELSDGVITSEQVITELKDSLLAIVDNHLDDLLTKPYTARQFIALLLTLMTSEVNAEITAIHMCTNIYGRITRFYSHVLREIGAQPAYSYNMSVYHKSTIFQSKGDWIKAAMMFMILRRSGLITANGIINRLQGSADSWYTYWPIVNTKKLHMRERMDVNAHIDFSVTGFLDTIVNPDSKEVLLTRKFLGMAAAKRVAGDILVVDSIPKFDTVNKEGMLLWCLGQLIRQSRTVTGYLSDNKSFAVLIERCKLVQNVFDNCQSYETVSIGKYIGNVGADTKPKFSGDKRAEAFKKLFPDATEDDVTDYVLTTGSMKTAAYDRVLEIIGKQLNNDAHEQFVNNMAKQVKASSDASLSATVIATAETDITDPLLLNNHYIKLIAELGAIINNLVSINTATGFLVLEQLAKKMSK